MKHNLHITYYKCFLFILLFIFSAYSSLFSQQVNTNGKLFPSAKNDALFEIGDVVFLGNKNFDSEALQSVISSFPTKRSIPHKVLQYYFNQLQKNKSVKKILPDAFDISLNNILNTMSNEIKYYNRRKAREDVTTLKNFYYQRGFHEAEIRFEFVGDSTKKINILKFIIDEQSQYHIKAINYLKLDPILAEIDEKLHLLKQGDAYNELLLMQEIRTIHYAMLNDGYYYASFSNPVVSIDTMEKTDSITITFSTGKQQKIDNIHYIDSTKGQPIVAYDMKERQLEFKKGDLYKSGNIERSINNLLSLGTFDLVSIDTTSLFEKKTDSTLSFRVFTQYIKQQEYGFSTFINNTAVDKFLNAGVELSYFNRNIFGAAQSIKPFIRLELKDISRSINNPFRGEYEFQMGIDFAQPLLYTLDQARIGLSFQFLWSIRTIDQTLRLNTISIPVKFPARLLKQTYFNQFELNFTFERQYPMNYEDALNKAFQEAHTYDDTLQVIRAFYIYENLDIYNRDMNPWLTSNIIGASIMGDTRDNPFSPTKGYFVALSVDGWNFTFYPFEKLLELTNQKNKLLGIAKYFRFQLTNTWFSSLSDQLVFAVKQREGLIYWFDKQNSYVPFERQFFAGGANSVRGWASRQLRYIKDTSVYNTTVYNYLSDLVGSGVLIEGSMELRYHFVPQTKLTGGFTDGLGITGFIDWGNVFQWLVINDKTGDYEYNNKWYEYFTGLALAAGFGLRYDTPVGPFRIDIAWPVYDPTRFKDQIIFSRQNAFNTFQFHIGLGHAF